MTHAPVVRPVERRTWAFRSPALHVLADPGLSPFLGEDSPLAHHLEGDPPPWFDPAARADRVELLAFGIYPARAGEPAWMSPRVGILLGAHPAAEQVVVDTWIPPELLAEGPVRVVLTLSGTPLGEARIDRAGAVLLAAPLPPGPTRLPSAAHLLELTFEHGFRPCDRGTSGDVRLLAAICNGCGFATAGGNPLRREDRPAPRGPLPTGLPGVHGSCTICGAEGIFRFDPARNEAEGFRCPRCGAPSRWRMLARGMLGFLLARGWRARSLAELREAVPGAPVRILDTCSSWPPASLLRGIPGIDLVVSEYDPDATPGSELAPGVRCENLERLTLPDDSLDLLLTSDVLEHVRLYRRALAEAFRVLRPGGEFLFTVPHVEEGDAHHVYREVVDPDDPSRDRDLAGPVYHEDTRGGGSLVYRVYALHPLLAELREQGFLVAYERRTIPGLALPNQALFRAVKPGGRAASGRT